MIILSLFALVSGSLARGQDVSPPSAPKPEATQPTGVSPVAKTAVPTPPGAPAQGTVPVAPGSQFDANNRTVPVANTQSPLEVVASDKDGLDLEESFRLAAVRSDTLLIDKQSIRAAQAQLSQAVAQLFPTVNLVNSEDFQKSASKTGGFTISGGSVTTNGGKLYSNATQLTVSQVLFNGFSNYNNVGAEQANVASQRYSLQYGYQTLYQDVAQAFYQILTNEADLVVLGDTIRALEVQVSIQEHWVQIGRSRPSDLLQSKAQLAGVKVTVEQTKGLLAAAKELMAFYIGIPAGKFKLRETQVFPTAQNLEDYLRAVGARPDILAQVEQERMASRQLSVAKGALFPTISASGSYNLTTYPQQTQEWYASLQISLPLFDGGLIIDKINQQKALTRQSELNVENLRRTADQSLRTALANFESSAAQYVALHEQVELAGLNYNAQADDYKSGIVTNLDVISALSTLETARQQMANADINSRLNLILLHVAAGLVPTSLSTSPSSLNQVKAKAYATPAQ